MYPNKASVTQPSMCVYVVCWCYLKVCVVMRMCVCVYVYVYECVCVCAVYGVYVVSYSNVVCRYLFFHTHACP